MAIGYCADVKDFGGCFFPSQVSRFLFRQGPGPAMKAESTVLQVLYRTLQPFSYHIFLRIERFSCQTKNVSPIQVSDLCLRTGQMRISAPRFEHHDVWSHPQMSGSGWSIRISGCLMLHSMVAMLYRISAIALAVYLSLLRGM